MDWQGLAGEVWSGWVWNGKLGRGRQGGLWRGTVGSGAAWQGWQVWRGEVGFGKASCGSARQVWLGMACWVVVGLGAAGGSRWGRDVSGTVWQAGLGGFGHGTVSFGRRGKVGFGALGSGLAGTDWLGGSGFVVAWQARLVELRRGVVC